MLKDARFPTGSPPVRNHFPTSSEPMGKSSARWRMEDGGRRKNLASRATYVGENYLRVCARTHARASA